MLSGWGGINFFPDSFALTGLIEAAAMPYLGIKVEELSLDEKAELLLVDQRYTFFFSFFLYLHFAVYFVFFWESDNRHRGSST